MLAAEEEMLVKKLQYFVRASLESQIWVVWMTLTGAVMAIEVMKW